MTWENQESNLENFPTIIKPNSTLLVYNLTPSKLDADEANMEYHTQRGMTMKMFGPI